VQVEIRAEDQAGNSMTISQTVSVSSSLPAKIASVVYDAQRGANLSRYKNSLGAIAAVAVIVWWIVDIKGPP